MPNEFLEAYFPLAHPRIQHDHRFSGGAGLHRGGNGITIAYEMMEKGEISIHDDRWLTYPWGVNGGEPGMRSTKRNWCAPTAAKRTFRRNATGSRSHPGDILYFNTWGGGGWGNPLERDPETGGAGCQRAGLVSEEGARRYGVVCRERQGGQESRPRRKLRNKMAG